MNRTIQSLFIATTGLTIAFAIGNGTANASTYQFTQEGWLPGEGKLLGSFSGEDLRGGDSGEPDGIISLAQGEVSFFEMSFQGSTTINAFEHNYENLFVFEYSLANPETLKIFSSNIPRGGVTSYDGEEKLIQQHGESDLTIVTGESPIVTEEDPIVREIPEPNSLIGLTLFGLGVCLKSKRRLGKD